MKNPMLYICAECANTACESADTNRTCVNCGAFVSNRITIKGLTNADRIRAMTDEELADMLSSISCCHEKGQNCMKYSDETGGRNCCQCWLDWLKQEVDDENAVDSKS